MKNRFDLENEINTLYSFSNQLSLLSEGILEHDLGNDEVVNVIEGLRVTLDLQTQKLHDTMSQCFKLDNYSNTESFNYP
jgi:hypothetical protein